MKLVLILNVIDFRIGGVMIMGDCGIGKLIIICVVVDFLLEIKVVEGDFFNFFFEDFELMSEFVKFFVMWGE